MQATEKSQGRQLADKDTVFQNLVLEKLICSGGKEEPNYMRMLLEAAGLEFFEPQFAVLVIRVFDLKEGFLSPGPSRKYYEDFVQVGKIIGNRMVQMFSKFGKVFCVNKGDGILCLLNLCAHDGVSDKALQHQLAQRAERAAELLCDMDYIDATIAISALYDQITDLSEGYASAYKISLYNIVSKKRVSIVERAGILADYNYDALFKNDYLFYDAINRHDFAFAQELFGQYACELLLNLTNGYQLLPAFLFKHIQRALTLYTPALSPEIRQRILLSVEQCIHQYGKAQADGFGTTESLLRLSEQLITFLQEQLESLAQNTDAVDRAAAYLKEHYSDKNISISEVANYVGLRSDKFSRAFSRKIGLLPLDFLHLQRICAAKYFLTESTQTIEQIADQIGYQNARALIVAFKRYEGITPGTYRKNAAFKKAEKGREERDKQTEPSKIREECDK